MKRLFLTLAVVAVAVTSCQKDVVYNDVPEQNQSVEIANSNTRSYEEALAIAEDALTLLEGDETRSATKRVIKRNEGQTVMRPVTRGSETSEEPIMYVFNNEDNQGFTVVAADKSKDPLIAVTELGSYTYGEPTGVEPFDLLMEEVSSQLTLLSDPIPLPNNPLVPTPGRVDTVHYFKNRVEPIILTNWGQDGIYGKYCSNGLAGCTNVAIGQIIAHHCYPSSIKFTYLNHINKTHMYWADLTCHTQGLGSLVDGDYRCFCGCNYELLAKFLRELGHRTHTDYNDDILATPEINERGSGASIADATTALIGLGYRYSIHAQDVNIASYLNEIIENIDNDRPVVISGFNPSNIEGGSGHTWIIDGYDFYVYKIDYYGPNPNYHPILSPNEPELAYSYSREHSTRLFHFNWGWYGICNGWFNYNCFKPGEAIEYDNNSSSYVYNFCNDIDLIYNIQQSI